MRMSLADFLDPQQWDLVIIDDLESPMSNTPARLEVAWCLTDDNIYVILAEGENPSTSVTNAIEFYAVQVTERLKLDPFRCVLIECYLPDGTAERLDPTFDFVTLDTSQVTTYLRRHGLKPLKRFPLLNNKHPWSPLPREMVQTLSGLGVTLSRYLGRTGRFRQLDGTNRPFRIGFYDGRRYYEADNDKGIPGILEKVA